MKQKTFVILLISAGVLLAGAAAGYRILSENYTPDSSSGAQTQEQEKQTAPDFTVLNQAGEGTTLSAHFGKPLVVNFWATWCGPCKSELPAFEAEYKAHSGEVEFLMVNLTDGSRETVEVVNEFIEENGYTFPVYYDTLTGAAKAYSVYSVPVTYFISSDGTIHSSYLGAMSADMLEQYLNALLASE